MQKIRPGRAEANTRAKSPTVQRQALISCYIRYLGLLHPPSMAEGSSSSSNAGSIAHVARQAFEATQLIDPAERDTALGAIRSILEESRDDVLAANRRDMQVCFPPLTTSTY